MAILDGQEVADSVIDPAKHIFIGMFREPTPPKHNGGYIFCQCGETLTQVGEEAVHWLMGHFDKAQYVTITKEADNEQ